MISSYMNKNGEKTKLLAAVAVLAMVLCALAIAIPAADAADDETGPLNFEGEVSSTTEDASNPAVVGNQYSTALKATNAGLGNNIQVSYDPATLTYTLTGFLNEQDISYEKGWKGTNQTNSAKAGYSYHYKYAETQQYYWLTFTSNTGITSITNASGVAGALEDGNNTEVILLLTTTSMDTVRDVVIGDKTYKIDLTGLDYLDDTYVAEKLTVGDISIELPAGLVAKGTVADDVYDIDFVGSIDGVFADDGTFQTTFTNTVNEPNVTPWGYGYLSIDGVDTIAGDNSNIQIVQKNPALGNDGAYANQKVDEKEMDLDKATKTKDYATTAFSNDTLDFLVPKTGDKVVTVTINAYTPGEEGKEGTVGAKLATIGMDFSGVTYNAAVVDDASEIQNALSGSDSVTYNGDGTELSTAIEATVEEGKGLTLNNVKPSATVPVTITTVSADGEDVETANFYGMTIETLTVSQGSIFIDGVKVTAPYVNADGKINANIVLSSGSNLKFSGDNTVAGTIKISAVADAKEKPVVDILRSATVTLENGTAATDVAMIVFENVDVSIKGTVEYGTIVAGDGATVTIDGTVTSDVTKTEGGTIVNNTSTVGNITLSDGSIVDNRTSVNGSISQEIIVAGDVTVVSGGVIEVNGLLTIQKDAVLTLEQGAKLVIYAAGKVVNDGTIVVEASTENTEDKVVFVYGGSSMEINGALDLQGAYAFDSTDGAGISVNGTMNVGDDATADIETVVDVGKPIVLNTSSSTTSVSITAKRMHITSSK